MLMLTCVCKFFTHNCVLRTYCADVCMCICICICIYVYTHCIYVHMWVQVGLSGSSAIVVACFFSLLKHHHLSLLDLDITLQGACIHTYIHTYIHAYILYIHKHTQIHTHMFRQHMSANSCYGNCHHSVDVADCRCVEVDMCWRMFVYFILCL